MSAPLRSKRDSLVSLRLQELHEALADVGVQDPVRADVEAVAQKLIAREAQQRALQQAARGAHAAGHVHHPFLEQLLHVMDTLDEELLQAIPPLVRALRRAGGLPPAQE